MKKNKNSKIVLIISIICNISIIMCLIVGLVLMFKFNPPKIIERDAFINYMSKNGCSTIDLQEQNKYDGINDYLLTKEDSCPYIVSYVSFYDKKKLNYFFNQSKNNVLNDNKNVTSKTSINMFSTYSEFSTSGDYYKSVVLNRNSVFYISVKKEYREDAISILNYFNYQYQPNFNGNKIIWFSLILILLIFMTSMWGLEKKIRNNGWIGIIPIYNIICISKDVLGSGFYALLLFVPVANIVFQFLLYYKIGESFGKDIGSRILLMIFPTFFLPVIAFDDSKYNKIKKEKSINYSVKMYKNKNIIKWFFAIIFFLSGILFIGIYFSEEKVAGYIFSSIMSFIYSLMMCPLITRYTKKFIFYTKYKILIIVSLIIINIVLFTILPY